MIDEYSLKILFTWTSQPDFCLKRDLSTLLDRTLLLSWALAMIVNQRKRKPPNYESNLAALKGKCYAVLMAEYPPGYRKASHILLFFRKYNKTKVSPCYQKHSSTTWNFPLAQIQYFRQGKLTVTTFSRKR